jgi:hypothetical protein
MNFPDLTKTLKQHPTLFSALDFYSILKFINLIHHLWPMALQEVSYHLVFPVSTLRIDIGKTNK